MFSSVAHRAVLAVTTLSALVVSASALVASASATPTCRDRFLWPFNDSSVWNNAIGSDAVYFPGGIYDNSTTSRGLPHGIHNDQDWLMYGNGPSVGWIDDSGNFPGSCTVTGPIHVNLTLPYETVTDCGVENNNGAGVLLASDNITLIQFQPFYREKAGGDFVAWYHTGAPQPFPWEISILGDGNLGAHGGSGLSSFGGTIRQGELLPGAPPIQHALKLELWAHTYYYYDGHNYSSCYQWPAIGCDSYALSPTIGYQGINPYLKPGALLAVPPNISTTLRPMLQTIPGAKILDALTDYGGYIVDDTGSEIGGGAICMEHEVNAEIESAYGYSVAIENPLNPTQGASLFADIVAIFQALHVVINNGPTSLGGGGVPRQPLPPPICGA